MSGLFRFSGVRCENLDRAYSFTLHSGEVRLLTVSSGAAKNAMLDLATGESVCKEGTIEIVPGGSGYHDTTALGFQRKKKQNSQTDFPAWQLLSESRPGRVGWVAADGGLISNLKIWENVTLPHWYHVRREVAETEQSIRHWLAVLGFPLEGAAELMAALPYSIEPWQRKLAGLLRALVHMPRVMVMDADVLDDISEQQACNWIHALEAYAAQGHTVLAIADKAAPLSWKEIE